MSSRRAQTVLIVEDQQQEIFARKILYEKGYDHWKIRVRRSPAGKGSAEQFVRENYPIEVREYRCKRNRVRQGLVVMIDTDVKEVQDRFNELDEALIQQNLPIRDSQDAVALFIPKRNIETWILFLQGENVDETTDYRGKLSSSPCDCETEVENMINGCREDFNGKALPSLRTACQELARIPR